MNKREFMLEYRKKLGIKNLEKVDSKINNFWDSVFEILKEKKKLNLRGFGSFEVKEISSRNGISPYGEFTTNDSKTVKFRVGKDFRERLK